MRLLVTGAHGLLGRTLLGTDWGPGVELIASGRRPEPVGTTPCHAVDLEDAEAVRRLAAAVRPDRVVHTAALTNVDLCQTKPDLARRANLEVVAHVAAACADTDAGLVHLSTDYVFDGTAGPYAETDATNPLSHYGRLKLESEGLVLGGAVDGLVVRTLWLYGHRDGARPNLVTWPLLALARGEPVRVVSDQWGNPTHAGDLARALVGLCLRRATGLFHMGGATFLTRHDLLRRAAARFGLDPSGAEVVTTAHAGQAAPRPLRSGLRTGAIERELGWRPASLDEGLDRLAAQEGFARQLGDPRP